MHNQLFKDLFILDEQAELLEVGEVSNEDIHALLDDLEEEPLADHQDLLVMLLETQEGVLVVVLNKVDGELTFVIQAPEKGTCLQAA